MRALFLVAALCVIASVVVRADDDAEANTGDAPEVEPTAQAPAPVAAPFLLVHKTASHSNVAVGTPVEVTVTAINIGNAPAYRVTLTDAGAHGKDARTKSEDELLPGSNVSISYAITPSGVAGSKLFLDRALVTYATEKGAEPTSKALSNLIREDERDETKPPADLSDRGNVNVVTAAEYERLTSKRIAEMIVSVALAASLVGFPYMLFKAKQGQADKLLAETRKGK